MSSPGLLTLLVSPPAIEPAMPQPDAASIRALGLAAVVPENDLAPDALKSDLLQLARRFVSKVESKVRVRECVGDGDCWSDNRKLKLECADAGSQGCSAKWVVVAESGCYLSSCQVP